MIIKFGYKIENGIFEVDEVRQNIYIQAVKDYSNGKSLKTIANELTVTSVEYSPGKIEWNKNRVQRMLTDKAYLGTELYPPAISQKDFDSVQTIMQARNTQKECNRQEVFSSSVVPILCGKCGHPTIRRFDSRWKYTVKHYCTNPECNAVYRISDEALWDMVEKALPEATDKTYTPSDERSLDIYRLTNEIEHDLQGLDIDADAIQKKIFECAALQYSVKRTTKTESMNFSKMKPCSPAFIRELKRLLSAVTLIDETNIRLIPTAGKEYHNDRVCTD